PERPFGRRRRRDARTGLEQAQGKLHLERRVVRVGRTAAVCPRVAAGPKVPAKVRLEPGAISGAGGSGSASVGQGARSIEVKRIGRTIAEFPAAAGTRMRAIGEQVDALRVHSTWQAVPQSRES